MNDQNNRKNSGRGFASMDPEEVSKIASKGGKAAHQTGKAHEWNSREAQEAGRKGGKSRGQNASSGSEEDDTL